MTSTTLRVPAIHCDACVRSIADAVGRLSGVDGVDGDADARLITVTYEADRLGLDLIRQAIDGRGFAVTGVVGDAGVAALPQGRPLTEPDATAPRTAGRWPLGLAAVLAVCCALPIAGYLAGFLGYAYGVAVPGAFDRFSVSVVAVVSGLAAFFSPCVFPLLPGYIAFQAGASRTASPPGRLAIAGAAAAGLTLANLAIAGVIGLLGAATPFQPDPRQEILPLLAIRFSAGAAIVVLGLAALRGRTLGPLVARLAGRLSGRGQAPGRSLAGSFLFGLTYTAAGLGCTGPILLSLVLYAVVSGQALLAFAVFAFTMGGSMFAVTLLAGLLGRLGTGRLAGASERLQRIGAVVLVIAGTYTMVSLSVGPGRELFVRTFLPFLP